MANHLIFIVTGRCWRVSSTTPLDTRTEHKGIHSQSLSQGILLMLEFPLLSNQGGLMTTKVMMVESEFGYW
jgi:hypothetical protein